MTDTRLDAVERFYDFHPINAKQILDAVVARGIAPDALLRRCCSSMTKIITEAPRQPTS